ncbi:hypothetical protein LNA01_07910 [Companilactobacillus nantensis]|nr:hypothetical protein LNA01_07910 [Companilactobacillus nantensis]
MLLAAEPLRATNEIERSSNSWRLAIRRLEQFMGATNCRSYIPLSYDCFIFLAFQAEPLGATK